MVPLGRALAAILRRETAIALVSAEGFHRRAVNRKDIAVTGIKPLLTGVPVNVGVIQDLNLDAAGEGGALGRVVAGGGLKANY